ncbi:MAG: Crp/Fnr family transcriptional regulator, partial [Rhizobiales bacterium]|nr:Crp/Fnr family transcriptional regulator [Hyphomicrobiales bacterium]
VIVAPGERAPFLGILARPGFWIGEASVITRGPRAIGIVAVRDSLAAHLPLKHWDAVVGSEPEAWRWVALLSLRNSLLALAVIDALRMPRSEERMAAVLAILSWGPGAQATGANPARPDLPIEISQEELAQMANLSRSSAGRILDAFEARGLISRSYRMVRVLDPDGLKRRSDD